MLTYIYTARNQANGQKVTAEVEAENESAAARLLLERGMAPLDIKVKGEKRGLKAVFSKVPSKQKVIFSRQLATLINAGLPLVQSLTTVRDQIKHKEFKAVISKVIQDIEAGASLANALAKHPKVFDEVYVSLIAAGEASGTLDKSLERLASQQEKDAEILAKVRGAMMYPIIVLVVLMAVVIFMMSTVLPQVQNLYSAIPGATLPGITRLMLGVANGIKSGWWIILIILALFGFLFSRYGRVGAGKEIMDRLKLHMWPVAPLFVKLYMARFARVASTLVGSGVPIIKMLSTSAASVGNVQIANAINKAAEDVRGGKSLSETLARDKNFPELVPGMIRIGEQSGQLESMLAKLADYYEKELDDQIKSISTIIEPVLMIAVGIVALIVVAAVLLPIYSLAGKNLNF